VIGDRFTAPGVRIERHVSRVGKPPDVDTVTSYTVWRPHASIHCRTPAEVLRFIRWPVKTPTGDAIRAWLAHEEGPAAAEPQEQTKMVV
jgi:hypothetical protein